jgi:hypothetical protein
MGLCRLQVYAGVVTDILAGGAGACSCLAGPATGAGGAGGAASTALLVCASALAGLAVATPTASGSIAGTRSRLTTLAGDAGVPAGSAVGWVAADIDAGLAALDRGRLALLLFLLLFGAEVVRSLTLIMAVISVAVRVFPLIVLSLLVAGLASPLLACLTICAGQEWKEETSEQSTERPAPGVHGCNATSQAVKSRCVHTRAPVKTHAGHARILPLAKTATSTA